MNPITVFITLVLAFIGLGLSAALTPLIGGIFILLAVIVLFSLKMAKSWERFVILRAGRFHGVKGPGLFAIVPVLDFSTKSS